jgi:hypothetical protein
MDLEDFKTARAARMTPTVKKALFVLFFLSFLMFVKYAPYGNTHLVSDTLGKQLFILYFFIVNQTLGIVHEVGHGVCYLLHCPEFVAAANGTVFQLLFPFLIGYYYKRKGQRFAYFIGLFFLGISLHYSAWYMSTAGQGLFLPASKSFLGVDGLHDFNFILTQLHLLEYHKILAGFFRFVAFCIMLYSLGYMFVLAFFTSRKT